MIRSMGKIVLFKMKNIIFKSLKNKLVFLHMMSIMITTILISVVVYSISISMQIKDAKYFESQIVWQIGTNLNNIIKKFDQDTFQIVSNSDMKSILKKDYGNAPNDRAFYLLNSDLLSIVTDYILTNDNINCIYLFDKNIKRVYFSRDVAKADIIGDKPEKDMFLLNGKVSAQIIEEQVFFNRVVRDFQTGIIGYLSVTMDKQYIKKNLNSINYSSKRFIIVTNEKNDIIEHNFSGNEEQLADILNAIKPLQADQSEIKTIDSFGKALLTTQHIDSLNWKVVSCIKLNELIKGPTLLARYIVILGLIAMMIGAVFSLFISNRIVKPMDSLTSLLKEVEKGNFDVSIDVRGTDEISKMGNGFNQMVKRIRNLIVETYQKELQVKNAELKALQAQVSPHFLYNTFDCINWLAEYGKTQEVKAVTLALAHLMKTSADNKQSTVKIAQELEYIKSYLSIFEISMQGTFYYNIEVEEGIMDYYIPKLILQPLVENAIVHGLKNKIGYKRLHLKGFIQDEEIIFQIFDNGVGIENGNLSLVQQKKPQGTGLGSGLKNVIDRIRLTYGEKYGIKIESSANMGTVVEVNIPIQKKVSD